MTLDAKSADPTRSDNLTPEQRRRCMSSVRTKDTLAERQLCTALHQKGLRYRKHVRELPGCPDIVFTRARLAIFVDGDFWHGRALNTWEHKLSPFWQEKIAKNMARDKRNTENLKDQGWAVMRVWEYSIEKDLLAVVAEIGRQYRERLNLLGESLDANVAESRLSRKPVVRRA